MLKSRLEFHSRPDVHDDPKNKKIFVIDGLYDDYYFKVNKGQKAVIYLGDQVPEEELFLKRGWKPNSHYNPISRNDFLAKTQQLEDEFNWDYMDWPNYVRNVFLHRGYKGLLGRIIYKDILSVPFCDNDAYSKSGTDNIYMSRRINTNMKSEFVSGSDALSINTHPIKILNYIVLSLLFIGLISCLLDGLFFTVISLLIGIILYSFAMFTIRNVTDLDIINTKIVLLVIVGSCGLLLTTLCTLL